MKDFQKGLGWILFGILLVLASFGGPLRVIGLLWISADTLRWLGLLCGIAGISYLYLQDVSRFRDRDGRDGRN